MKGTNIRRSLLNSTSITVFAALICGGGNTLCIAQTTVTTPTIAGIDLGGDTGPQFGQAIAAGDFDGDGKREIAISTFESMDTGFGDNEGHGHIYVYEYDTYWSVAPIEVPHPGTFSDCVFFGWTMVAGDVDNDGKDELVVSEPGGDGAGADSFGAVYIFDYDNTSDPTFVLKHKFHSHSDDGGQLGDNFGWSIALADYNGDGDLDLIVGARYWSQCEDCVFTPGGYVEDWTGAVYVFDHDNWESPSNWRNVDEAELVIRGEASWDPVNGGEQTRGYFGARVASLGDVNDDGYDDFVAAATRRTPSDYTGACGGQAFSWWNGSGWTSESLDEDCRVGKVYLFAGASTFPGNSNEQDAEAFAKVVFHGEDGEDKFGQTIAAGGDIIGDGVNDLVVASRKHHESGTYDIGRAYVFLLPDWSGGWPSTFDDKHWDAAEANIIIDGPTADQEDVWFGYEMACDGNTNKQTDSRADILIGAPLADSCTYSPSSLENGRGFAFLFRYSGSMSPGEDGGHIGWSAVSDCAEYYRIHCDPDYRKYSPQLGRSVAFIGDANVAANGNDDFVIGSPGWDYNTYPSDPDDRGCVYVILH